MSEELDTAYIERLVDEFKKNKELQEQVEKRTTSLKKELTEYVSNFGSADDKGHMWLEVGDLKLKKERRVSRSLDTSKATEWAKENGYWDEIKEVIEVLSEDKLLGLAWGDDDMEAIVQSMYIEKEVWAFKV